MAPDDLKFSRIEARLQDQQRIMAELAQPAARQGKHVAAAASPDCEQQRQDPTMISLFGPSGCGGGGGGSDNKEDGPRESPAARPFAAALASRSQKYGACETTARPAGEQCKGAPAAGAKLHESLPADATIGGNKFVAADKKKSLGADSDSGRATVVSQTRRSKPSLDSELGNEGPDRGRGHEERPCIIQRLAKIIPCFGILLSLGASFFLGTAGMLVKLVESVAGIEVAVIRAMIQIAIYGGIIAAKGTGLRPSRGECWPVAGRAILGGVSITCSYYALKLIPLGDATTIRFSLPIWALIMSYFFLNESCSLYKVFAVFISISGVILVTKPDDCVYVADWLVKSVFGRDASSGAAFESLMSDSRPAGEDAALHDIEEITMLVDVAAATPPPLAGQLPDAAQPGPNNSDGNSNSNNLTYLSGSPNATAALGRQALRANAYSDPLRQVEGCLMALASSVCLAMSIIALRMCKQTPSEISIFWLSLSSVTVGFVTLVMMNKWAVPSNFRDCLYILLNGLCGALGQWFMTNALKVEQSGLIALARTFDIEVAFLYSALLLGEEIRPTSIIGSVLVSLGVITVLVPRWLGCGGGGGGGGNDPQPDGAPPAEQADPDWPADELEPTKLAQAAPPSTSGASSQTATDEEELAGKQEAVRMVLNGFSLDARRSLPAARSIQCLRRTVETQSPKVSLADDTLAGPVARKAP